MTEFLIHNMLLVRAMMLIALFGLAVFVASRIEMKNKDIAWAAIASVVLIALYLLIFNSVYLPTN